jgi:hypothetical protein
MTLLLAPALLMTAQAIPAGTFRPTVSVKDALTGLQMCRAVITQSGFDPTPIKKARWQTVGIAAPPGQKDDGTLAGIQAWQVPGSFAMVMVTQKDGNWRCNVAAPVRNQKVGTELMAKLPVHLDPAGETGVFEGWDNGQKIHVSLGDVSEYPTINLTVTRPTEPK